MNLKYRKAKVEDLKVIVAMLQNDDLGKTRESFSEKFDSRYMNAFEKINKDSNQYLMIVELDAEIVATCHLTIMPSLTFTGSTRLQIEAVRVSELHRGKKIGEWMISEAIEYGKAQGATIIQLSSNKIREDAIRFYENLGFESSHVGMKLYLDS